MDFDLSPDHELIRRTVREFAEGEIAPHVMEWDEAQTFPLEVVRKLGQLGYMGAIFPEDLGGAGLGYIEYAIVIEELSRVDGSVGIIVAAHTSLCSNHIYKMGSDEQRRKYIPKLASGEWLGCWSLTEPEAGSDAAGTRTKAVRDGADLRLEQLKPPKRVRPIVNPLEFLDAVRSSRARRRIDLLVRIRRLPRERRGWAVEGGPLESLIGRIVLLVCGRAGEKDGR